MFIFHRSVGRCYFNWNSRGDRDRMIFVQWTDFYFRRCNFPLSCLFESTGWMENAYSCSKNWDLFLCGKFSILLFITAMFWFQRTVQRFLQKIHKFHVQSLSIYSSTGPINKPREYWRKLKRNVVSPADVFCVRKIFVLFIPSHWKQTSAGNALKKD